MVRRFPNQMTTNLGFEGAPMMSVCLGITAIVGGAFLSRYLFDDNKIEASKRHHPKGIGFTNINKQKELLRQKIKKFKPNLDESYYEYSRHNPTSHR